MEKSKTISAALWLGLNSIASKVIWAATLIVLMHNLGPKSYGLLASTWAYFGLIAALTDIGSGQSMLRTASRNPSMLKSYLSTVLILKGTLTTFALTLVCILFFVYQEDNLFQKWVIIFFAGGAILFDHFQTLYVYVSQIIHRLGTYTIIRLCQSVLLFITLWLILIIGGREDEVSIAHFLITLIFMFVSGYVFFTIREISDLSRVPITINRVIREGIPFLGTALLNLAYYRIDVILLSLLATQKLTGIYSGQYQLILTLYAFPAILVSAILPGLYKLSKMKDGIKYNLNIACKYLNILGMLFFPCIFFYAKEIMELIGGQEFTEEYQGLQILSFLIPMFMFTVILNALVAIDKIKLRLICELSALLIIICFGPFAIAYFGLIGMASIAVSSYLFSGLLGIRFLWMRGYCQISKILFDFSKIILAVIPGLLIFLFSNAHYSINCVLYILLFLTGLSILKIWDSQDKMRFKHVLNFFKFRLQHD